MSRAPMSLGVISFTDHMRGAELLDFARRVEAWGYDSLWVLPTKGVRPFRVSYEGLLR